MRPEPRPLRLPRRAPRFLGADGAVGKAVEGVLGAAFLAEGLHDGNAGEGLLDVRLEADFEVALEPGNEAQGLGDEE